MQPQPQQPPPNREQRRARRGDRCDGDRCDTDAGARQLRPLDPCDPLVRPFRTRRHCASLGLPEPDGSITAVDVPRARPGVTPASAGTALSAVPYETW
ncbi:hypothetical protein AB0K88_15005 [Streptomyces werraensis]|uniref:hypothetical protein n=1 Tax=Streptomyces werraensis TaxID=68284 RepID=UPI00342EBA78